MRALRYAWDEALGSLWRGRRSGALSTATIALALFVLGAFLLLTANLQRLGREWSGTAEMSVYLADAITGEQRSAVERAVAPGRLVVSNEYVSKAAALERFRQTFGDLSSAVDSLDENPLPASYEVRLQPDSSNRAGIDALSTSLGQMEGVSEVRYDRQWLDRLLSIIDIIRGVGLALGAVLAIAAALTVANCVRLALHARRDELDIMELVGAPPIYVRGPFIMEGLLQGGIGASAALILLAIGFFAVRTRYLAPLASALSLSSIRFLSLELCVALVAGGMLVGCLGGLAAAWSAPGRLTQS